MELTIGCTTRPYPGLAYEEAFERIAAAGYTDVAIFASQKVIPVRSDSTPQEVAAVRKAAAAAGVAPSMLISGVKLDLGVDAAAADYMRLIDNTAALGTTWLMNGGTEKEALYEAFFEVMRRTAPYAESRGVKITMKPHGGIGLTTELLIAADQKVNHPAFGICFDPGNIIYYTKGEMRPETDVGKVAPRVTTGIIKDCVVVDGKPDVMVTAGDGLVDFHTVLSGLVGGGFRGPLYVECVGRSEPKDVDRDIAFTLGYVKGILSAI